MREYRRRPYKHYPHLYQWWVKKWYGWKYLGNYHTDESIHRIEGPYSLHSIRYENGYGEHIKTDYFLNRTSIKGYV